MHRIAACLVVVTGLIAADSPRHFAVEGLVVKVDAAHRRVMVSHDSIPGFMEAMAMDFAVRSPDPLTELKPGTKIHFTLFVDKDSSWIGDIRIVPFDSAAIDPVQVRRLRAIEKAIGAASAHSLHEGDPVPDFSLVDQNGDAVKLSEFSGKTVALNFIYTRCPLPDYCLRSSNNFGQLQKRFHDRLGRDLILLTVSFDTAFDQPEVLLKYARIWKADARSWHFLTGPSAEIQRVCGLFGVSYWREEGTMTHSLHTVIIDRAGKLASNIEGNQFTSEQLGDVLESVLSYGK
ncbi:MAG TPA: SCO family protein [Bryobacteraceae bacterium]|jgi:protein SCO1/2